MQERTGLVGKDVNAFAVLHCRSDDAERGAVAAGSESAGVAVGQHAGFIRQQSAAEFAHRFACGNVFLIHCMGFGQESFFDLGDCRAGG